MTSFNSQLPVNNGNIKPTPTQTKKQIPKEPQLSKYLPIIEQLEMKRMINAAILQLKAKGNEKERQIQAIFQTKDVDKIAKLREEKRRIDEEMAFFQGILPPIDDDAIFEMENELRMALLKDFPEKAKFQKIYDEQVLPLLHERKKQIREAPLHFSAVAAGERGKAAHAGLQAISSSSFIKKKTESSAQDVSILPEEKVVFKGYSKRAKEEEHLANELFNILSKKAVVGSFAIKTASKALFGMAIDEESVRRGHAIEKLDPATKKRIESGLSAEDKLLVQNWKAPPKSQEQKVYEYLSNKNFFLKQPGEEWQTVTFQQLYHLKLKDNLSQYALVGFSPEEAHRVNHLIQMDDMIAQGLNYSEERNPPTLLLTPNLQDPSDKEAYEACEKCKWKFTNSSGKTVETDFKTLSTYFYRREKVLNLEGMPTTPNMEVILQALRVPWKAISPELMQEQKTGLAPLSNVQAKPFIKMQLMKDLDLKERETRLNRLSTDAQLNAIWTGVVQLLDLHGGNLGLEPDPTPEYEQFKDLTFSTPSSYGAIDFYDLLEQYYEGNIQPDTEITYYDEEGNTIEKELKYFPELQKALDLKWKLVLFDTDYSLFEDNDFSTRKRKGIMQHEIPLRSCLLETPWKDRPIDDEVVQKLISTDLQPVKQWMAKLDAPIYQRLSPEGRTLILKEIAPYVQKYSLSEARYYEDSNTTMKDLSNQFVDEIVKIKPLWQIIENQLSQVKVRPGDTWETLAKRYHQDPLILELNNDGVLGAKIEIHYDVTSSSAVAVRRRKKIASELFPRLTVRQQDALIQRQERIKTYLTEYKKLKGHNPSTQQIAEFVKNPIAPLTSIRREEILKELPRLKKSDLLKEFEPTYFNVMKAIYPNLADAYALNQIFSKDDVDAGARIGHYSESLEKNIQDAKAKSLPPQIANKRDRLISHLEKEIASNTDPVFLGEW